MKLIDKQTILAALVGGLSALALTFGGVALAHGGPHGKGRLTETEVDAFLDEMIERLELSPAQERQVRAIARDAKTEAEDIGEMPRGKEKLLAFRDLHFATEDQIYANLTCDQREQFRLLKREHRAERMEKRFGRHHGSDDSDK